MRVIIIAGGKGTRIMEETAVKPKPMVDINGKPMLWHIMNIFSLQGFNEFIISTGYLHEIIDVWIADSNHFYNSEGEKFVAQSLYTGEETQTGGRISKIMEQNPGEKFLATYGDGLANVSIKNLIAFHDSKSRLATLTAVRPPARFGYLNIDDGLVTRFGEKNQADEGWINGGFFVLEPEVTNYIESPEEPFETGALHKLTQQDQLSAYQHFNFWQPMDTLREKTDLEILSKLDVPPWLKFL
jgi:glucose-1-phosphate cytidylyltransferase